MQKPQLPPIDKHFLDTVAIHGRDLDEINRHLPSAYARAEIEPDPRVAVPGFVSIAYAKGTAAYMQRLSAEERRGFAMLSPEHAAAVERGQIDSLWTAATFYGTYADTRRTYYIEPELQEMLTRRDLAGNTPTESLLDLPVPAFAMALPSRTTHEIETHGPMRHFAVFYDLLSGYENQGLEIRVAVYDRPNHVLQPYTVLALHDDTGRPLSLERGVAFSMERMMEPPNELEIAAGIGANRVVHVDDDSWPLATEAEVRAAHDQFLANALHVVPALLYMAGDPDVVERVGHVRPRPLKRHRRALAGTKHRRHLEASPQEIDVGVQIKAALIRYAEEAERRESDGVGSPKRPHMRVPHGQTYRYGPGKTLVKWVFKCDGRPISVNGGAPITPSVQPVR